MLFQMMLRRSPVAVRRRDNKAGALLSLPYSWWKPERVGLFNDYDDDGDESIFHRPIHPNAGAQSAVSSSFMRMVRQ